MASVTKNDNQPAVVTTDKVRGIANTIEDRVRGALRGLVVRHCVIECTDMCVRIAHNRVVVGTHTHVSPRASVDAFVTYAGDTVAIHLVDNFDAVQHVIFIDASKFIEARHEVPKN